MSAQRELGITLLSHQIIFSILYGLTLFSLPSYPWYFLLFFVLSPLLPLACWIWVKMLPGVLTWVSGKSMTKLGIANHLTLIRLASLPALSFLLLLSQIHPTVYPILAVWAGFAFLTDFLDGFLSRGLHQISRFGQALDSTSDYLLLIALLFALTGLKLLPWWLLVLALLRLVAQMIAMSVLMWQKKGLILETTFWGKAAVFALMTNLFTQLVTFFLKIDWAWWQTLVEVMNYLTGFILLISIVDKVLYFLRTIKKIHQAKS